LHKFFVTSKRGQITTAFGFWKAGFQDAKVQEAIMRRFVGRLTHKLVSMGFKTWVQYLRNNRRCNLLRLMFMLQNKEKVELRRAVLKWKPTFVSKGQAIEVKIDSAPVPVSAPTLASASIVLSDTRHETIIELLQENHEMLCKVINEKILGIAFKCDHNLLHKSFTANPHLHCPECEDAEVGEILNKEAFEYPVEWKEHLDGVKKADEMSERSALTLIVEILSKKLKADEIDDKNNNERDSMVDFVKDFMEFKYGGVFRAWKSLVKCMQKNVKANLKDRNELLYHFTRMCKVIYPSLDNCASDYTMDMFKTIQPLLEKGADKIKYPVGSIPISVAEKNLAAVCKKMKCEKELQDVCMKKLKSNVNAKSTSVGLDKFLVIAIELWDLHHGSTTLDEFARANSLPVEGKKSVSAKPGMDSQAEVGPKPIERTTSVSGAAKTKTAPSSSKSVSGATKTKAAPTSKK
jgi:hypothetical protein